MLSPLKALLQPLFLKHTFPGLCCLLLSAWGLVAVVVEGSEKRPAATMDFYPCKCSCQDLSLEQDLECQEQQGCVGGAALPGGSFPSIDRGRHWRTVGDRLGETVSLCPHQSSSQTCFQTRKHPSVRPPTFSSVLTAGHWALLESVVITFTMLYLMREFTFSYAYEADVVLGPSLLSLERELWRLMFAVNLTRCGSSRR